MRRKMVAANWKMNGNLAFTSQYMNDFGSEFPNGVDVIFFPPFVFVPRLLDLLGGKAAVGVQAASRWESGAYTGEISAEMAADVGCRYALVGHSERRHLLGETNEVVAQVLERTLLAGLVPVLCVGETLAERESGETSAVIVEQLRVCGEVISALPLTQVSLVVAYEPVWAIGTGKTAQPEDVQLVHALIRHELAAWKKIDGNCTSVLYGGSVKADNARALFSMPDVDGGLVGGASLNPMEFREIVFAAAIE